MKLLGRLSLLLVLMAYPCWSLGQERERIIVLQWEAPTPPHCPVTKDIYGKVVPSTLIALEIVNISVAGKDVALDQSFMANDEWLRDLKVRVKNVSGRPIVRVGLHFNLPEAKIGEAIAGFSLGYVKHIPASVDVRELSLILPGEEVEVVFGAEEYARYMKWITERSGTTSFSRVKLSAASLTFDDYTGWGGYPKMKGIKVNPQCP